jgi:hypothetical protein
MTKKQFLFLIIVLVLVTPLATVLVRSHLALLERVEAIDSIVYYKDENGYTTTLGSLVREIADKTEVAYNWRTVRKTRRRLVFVDE